MAVSVAPSEPIAVGRGGTASRIPAFDFTKGALVLFMVLFHWLNYFYGPYGTIYKYLRFLTPSFIFITGYLISHVHFSKYGFGSPTLSKRLFLRGIKLLGVFIILNLIIGLLVPTSSVRVLFSERSPWDNLNAIFVTGNNLVGGIGKASAFTILVPISYLLMISALLLIVCRSFKYTFHVACGLLLLAMILLDLRDIQSINLELLTTGLLGVVCGFASAAEIRKLVSHAWAIAVVYCGYLAAITIWNVSFYWQMVGVVLTTALIYIVGAMNGEPGRLRNHIVLLGKYSLFGYIAQIAILQVLRRALSHIDLGLVGLSLSLLAGFALTMISVEIVDRARSKSPKIDRCYRAVFA